MKNHLASQWRAETALKRGGGAERIPIDREWAEGNIAGAKGERPPEDEFDRNWACTLLRSVSARLEAFYDGIGKRELYESIKGCLEGEGSYGGADEIAARHGMSAEGVRSAVFKLRRRFREFIGETVSDTCAAEEDVRDEIAYLCRILAE